MKYENWPLKRVGLKVKDLTKMTEFYQKLGLKVVREDESKKEVGLGVGKKEVLTLRELKDGVARPPHSAGLYHFALLLPDESELGSFLMHAINNKIELEGLSDHLVSQAIYLRDPEGNGIEIYSDRSQENWVWDGKNITMATIRLDVQRLLSHATEFENFSNDLKLGHMHLNVGDLEKSHEFYKKLGMGTTAEIEDHAKFLSWDKYHHHLGINLWEGKGAKKHKEEVLGLDFFEVEREGLKPSTMEDADGVRIVIK